MRRSEWLREQGITPSAWYGRLTGMGFSGNLPSMERAWLTTEGFVEGALADQWTAFLASPKAKEYEQALQYIDTAWIVGDLPEMLKSRVEESVNDVHVVQVHQNEWESLAALENVYLESDGFTLEDVLDADKSRPTK